MPIAVPKKELTHIRFYFQFIEKLNRALTNEQMGRLFFALADYAMTGTKEPMDGDIIFPYSEGCYNIDRMRMGI